MVYRNQKESDDLLDKLVASTRSPHGQFTAEKSWPLLQKRIQGGFGWYLWYHRVASLAAVILLNEQVIRLSFKQSRNRR